ncbi:hypothetical protein BWQ96_02813 [Gracilariopsis chorda]|uniref:Uncharacterized protein n=1 Tax=Gracilariopsis chorda TaxID=448386 RepID=A0A2V3IZ94_9FLOR|nr:hypothetical protein BWQ96_02813 [Gracilariopsis chorda]|eukprot:PXF47482.1 hypothetical protein BWQ96_02813 [Gracilariopsis chorda]
MTTATPLDGTPSLRSVRDKYLALLLSGNPSSTAPPPPPQTPWTPGQHLPQAPAVHWASPVTPAPTENDVRLAEIAASLVAAGNTEKRHTDAIRRLAGQLDRSERKIRQLQRRDRVSSRTHRESAPRVSFGEAKRNIRFTPRTPKYDIPVRRAASEDPHRASQRYDEANSLNDREYEELQALRRERLHWLKARDRSEKEADRLSTMLADIKRNTQRLLEERHNHLKVIARLQDEVSEYKRDVNFTDEGPKFRSGRVNNIENVTPPRARERAQHPPVSVFQSHSAYAELDPGDITRGPERDNIEHHWQAHPAASSSRRRYFHDVEQVSPSPIVHSRREQELKEELRLVIEENGKLTERISSLEHECTELVKRVRFGSPPFARDQDEHLGLAKGRLSEDVHHPGATLGVQHEAPHLGTNVQLESQPLVESTPVREVPHRDIQESSHPNQERKQAPTAAPSIERPPSPSITDGLARLLAEVDVLEGVSQAIHFERSPSEADRMQDTTEIPDLNEEQTPSGRAERKTVPIASDSPRQVLLETVHRLGRIRSSLSLKYGKWLEAVANDETNACEETQLSLGSVQTPPPNQEVTTASMNTEVINKLIEN